MGKLGDIYRWSGTHGTHGTSVLGDASLVSFASLGRTGRKSWRSVLRRPQRPKLKPPLRLSWLSPWFVLGVPLAVRNNFYFFLKKFKKLKIELGLREAKALGVIKFE